MLNRHAVRENQVWQAKNYAQYNDSTVIIREINGDVIWVELRDGQKTTISRELLINNFLPITHL